MNCPNCGKKINDNDTICSFCGTEFVTKANSATFNSIAATSKGGGSKYSSLIKTYMVLGTILRIIFFIPLFWTIPMTIYAFRHLDMEEKIPKSFKICTLLFTSIVAGIIMLLDKDC